MEHAPWWADSRLRLGLLLAGLALAVLALLSVKTELFNRGSGSAQASGAAFAPGCPGQGAPEVKSVPEADLAALRNTVTRIMPPRVGRVYEAGTITTSNLWSDASPQRSSSSGSQAGSVPAGYEVRWWALDREGNEDDVVADVLEFAHRKTGRGCPLAGRKHPLPARWHGVCSALSVRRRQPLLDQSRQCRSSGTCSSPVAAACTASKMFRRDYPPATGPAQLRLERLRALMTVNVLACALPDADLPVRLRSLCTPPTWRPSRPARLFTQHRSHRSPERMQAPMPTP